MAEGEARLLGSAQPAAAAPPGHIDVLHENGIAVIALNGEHDMASVGQLERTIGAEARLNENTVVSLEHSRFIDSTIVAVLYRAHSLMQSRGLRLVLLSNPASAVHTLLEMTRLVTIIPTAETLDEAVRLARGDVA